MEKFVLLFLIAVCALLVSSQQDNYACDNCAQFANCRLPNCSCCGTSIPGEKANRPQLVFFSFDDAVTVRNHPLYVELFNETRVNPNGCPISMTLFVSHDNTDYRLVKNLYDKGMDIAVHGINHIKAKNIQQFTTEALGQRTNIATGAHIPESEIVGYRSPYLIPYGSEHFEILQNAGLEYDSTLTITKRSFNEDSPFPFTLDNGWPYPCSIPTCPTRPIPGFWELPVVSLIDRLGLYPCVYVDGCINEPLDEEESYNFLLQNFNSYYNKTKAPFGLNMHATWLLREYETDPYRMRAMHRFLDHILSLNDVYVVNMKQTMEWMKHRPTLHDLPSFVPFRCTQADMAAPEDVQTGRSFPDSVAEAIRPKRSPLADMPYGKGESSRTGSGSDIGGRPRIQITNPPNGNDTQRINSNRKPATTPGTRNVFRLEARLTISNITEESIKVPTSNDRSGSGNPIIVNPFSENQIVVDPDNQIVVDPKKLRPNARGRVFFVQNKKDAQRVINNRRMNQLRRSGSGASNSGQRSFRLRPNLSRPLRVVKPSSANLNMQPRLSATKTPKTIPVNAKSDRLPMSGSKTGFKNTYSADWLEKSFGIPQTVTAQIPVVKNVPTEQPKTVPEPGSKAFSADGLEESAGIAHTFTGALPGINHTSSEECKQRENCHLPDCLCQHQTPSLLPSKIPQFVYITYEGPVNESVAEKLIKLLTPQRTNWDGCRISGTVFVTSEGSNYTSIRKLHDHGLEIGLHGLKEKTLSSKLHSLEVAVQKYLLKRYAGIPEGDIKGWRSAGLQSRGDDQFASLVKSNLLYDASLFVMTNLDNRTGMWPFTLDFGWQNNCMLQDCPSSTYPSLWEVPAVPYVGIKKRYLCKFVDSCYNQPRMSVQTYDFLLDNFMGIYKGDRKPFGVRIRNEWLKPGNEENFKGLDAFIELLQELADVYVVSIKDLIKWMKDPVPHMEGEHNPEDRKVSC